MKLKFLKNTNQRLIFVLALLAGLLLALKILIPKEKLKIEKELISPTPTIPLPTFSPLSGKGDPNFRESLQSVIEKNYPLFDFVPFKTEWWSLDYQGYLNLKVILKKDAPEIRQEVLDWIESKGVDPKSHKIEW